MDDKTIKEIFGTTNPEGVLNEVQDTLSDDRQFIEQETKTLKDLAEGNKFLNAIQIADLTRQFFTVENKIKGSQSEIERVIGEEFQDAQRGRRDLQKAVGQSEIRIRKHLDSKLSNVTQQLVTLKDSEKLSAGGIIVPSNIEAFEERRPESEKTKDLASAIMVGAQPTMLGRNQNVIAATKTLGAFTRGITTDGAVDSEKLAALHDTLNEDKNIKAQFEDYIQAARKITAATSPSPKDIKHFERGREQLTSSGKFDNFDDDFLKSRANMMDRFKGMIQGSKHLPNVAYAKEIKELQRDTGLKQDQTTLARQRAEEFGDEIEAKAKDRSGIDDEGGEQAKQTKLMERNVKANEETAAATSGMGTSIMGILMAVAGLWALFKVGNSQVKDVTSFLGIDPSKGDWIPGTWGGGDEDGATGVNKLVTATTGELAEKTVRKRILGEVATTKEVLGTGVDAVVKGGTKVAEVVAKQGGAKVAEEIAEEVVEETVEATVKAAGKEAAEEVTEQIVKESTEEAGEQIAKKVGTEVGEAAAKSAVKKIPVVGFLAGLGFGAYRLIKDGDLEGAGLEVASGAMSTLPGLGTAGSVVTDVGLAVRDFQRIQLENLKDEGAFTKKNWGESTIDRDYEWNADKAKAILDWEGDDISDSDKQFLEGFISKEVLPTSSAVENASEELRQTEINVNQVFNNAPAEVPTPEVQVIASVPKASVSTRNHSFQRMNDQTWSLST